MRRAVVILSVALACGAVGVPDARATFPGKPGSIAFVREMSGDTDIWLATPSGRQRRLTNTPDLDERSPTFSPDGGLIAFAREEGTGFGYDIWIMQANGRRARPVVATSRDEAEPSFFPGGGSILFTRSRPGGNSEVLSIRTDGTDERLVAERATSGIASPDGRWLAYARHGRGAGIFLVNRRGPAAPARRLTRGSAGALDFAPDSRRIVFEGSRRCGAAFTTAILAVSIRGVRRTLRKSCDHLFLTPVWSPNGRRILFALKRSPSTPRPPYRLALMNLRGRLVPGAPRRRSGAEDLTPTWQAR